MAKQTDKLVSLILEQIKKVIPPSKPMYFDSVEDALSYYGLNSSGSQAEMGEMANIARGRRIEKLPQPMRIPISELSNQSKRPDKVISKDPDTGDFIEDVIIGDEIMILENGLELLKFQNYAKQRGVEGALTPKECVVLPEKLYYKFLPRSSKFGTQYQKKDYETAPEGESDEDREKRLARIQAIKEGNVKRFGIFPVINEMFSRHEILDHLDICLIPETWASNLRTEHTTNVIKLKKFGATGPDIDVDFYSARDLNDIESTIDSMLDLRAELAMGEEGAEVTRQREKSAHLPRRHANYIYTKGGNWSGKQRVHDKDFFEKYGGKTMIYGLNSKNIQEGNKQISIESVLDIKGNIVGNNFNNYIYVLRAKFTATLNARNKETGMGSNRGQLINPIEIEVVKPLPEGIDTESFNFSDNMDFFINEGRTVSKQKTGFFPDLINKLGDAILSDIDPDDVQQKVVQLAEEFAEIDEPIA